MVAVLLIKEYMKNVEEQIFSKVVKHRSFSFGEGEVEGG